MSKQTRGVVAGASGVFAAGLVHSLSAGWGTSLLRAIVSGAVAMVVALVLLAITREGPSAPQG